MDPILQGLQVSALGMMITFLALGLFILVIVVLKWLFPAKDEKQEDQTGAAEESRLLVEEMDAEEEGEVVAAIAVAVDFARSEKHDQLGDALSQGRGSWWSARGRKKGGE